MEVESEDEDDERESRAPGQPSQPDQDTQLQDMDEVRTNEVIYHCALYTIYLFLIAAALMDLSFNLFK